MTDGVVFAFHLLKLTVYLLNHPLSGKYNKVINACSFISHSQNTYSWPNKLWIIGGRWLFYLQQNLIARCQVFFFSSYRRHSDITVFSPCMLFLRLMYGLKQMAAMVWGIIWLQISLNPSFEHILQVRIVLYITNTCI